MVEFHRNRIVRRDVWFDEKWQADGADVMVFYHWAKPVEGAESQEVSSLEIDLTLGKEAIFTGFTSTARNLINRGIKEKLSFQVWNAPEDSVIDEFFGFQRQFSLERDMRYQEPVWMYDYAGNDSLTLTLARDPDGRALVWHTYFRNRLCARLLHSVSLSGSGDPVERKMTGWANRYLHWMDIVHLCGAGLQLYDFGGWYAGSTDEKLLRINAFKEQFGGRKTVRYHSLLPVSVKGRLFLATRRLLRKQPRLIHFV